MEYSHTLSQKDDTIIFTPTKTAKHLFAAIAALCGFLLLMPGSIVQIVGLVLAFTLLFTANALGEVRIQKGIVVKQPLFKFIPVLGCQFTEIPNQAVTLRVSGAGLAKNKNSRFIALVPWLHAKHITYVVCGDVEFVVGNVDVSVIPSDVNVSVS